MKRSIEDIPIVFIGTGNLATNLAKVLYRKGFRIVQVYSRTEESARELAQKVGAEYTTGLEEVNPYAKLYIISLKDPAFAGLLPAIVAGKRRGTLMVHTAGSIPMSIWEGYVSHHGMFYPMQIFSKQREVDFKEILFFIEASSTEDAALLKAIASTLPNRACDANSEQRKSLHLAAVFTCNFTNHIYALAAELLKKYNLPFDVMLLLIDETIREVYELKPKAAQAGPAIRYDENVIGNHLRVLADNPGMQQLYELLSRSIHERH